MEHTPKYGLVKPGANDFADIAVLNANADKLEAALDGLETGKETPAGAQAKADAAREASRPSTWMPTAADVGAAAPSVAVSVVLTAAGWVGAAAPYTQSIAVADITSANNLSVGLAAAATEAQERDAAGCRVKAAAQTAGSLGFTAQDKPVLDLPVTVLIFG